jgi:hypothetical protein
LLKRVKAKCRRTISRKSTSPGFLRRLGSAQFRSHHHVVWTDVPQIALITRLCLQQAGSHNIGTRSVLHWCYMCTTGSVPRENIENKNGLPIKAAQRPLAGRISLSCVTQRGKCPWPTGDSPLCDPLQGAQLARPCQCLLRRLVWQRMLRDHRKRAPSHPTMVSRARQVTPREQP